MGGTMAVKADIDEQIFEDAVSTLVGLGISKNEAGKLVKGAYKPEMTLEDIISSVLRGMSR
jgi:Holliday junction resolvasome RuvABC DNA-binding subunit